MRCALSGLLWFAVPLSAQMPGYSSANQSAERALEANVITLPSPVTADTVSRALSHEPHMAGSPAQARTRDYVIARMKQYGLETSVRSYDVYMPYPTSVHVWRVAPDTTELRLEEGPIAGDSTSSAFPQIPAFNGYGAAGDVSGPVVYVNYGLIEDYAHLDSIGVSVAGKVVLARYGHSYRGIKAREAEKHGALALLIYSDPADDGFARGDVFPGGPMRPEQGVQRGSVMNDNGDPSTPGYPSTAGAKRLSVAQMAVPRIPVVPISYHNAGELLRGLRDKGAPCEGVGMAVCVARDPELPAGWQGGLPFRYHVGPGPVAARVAVAVDTGAAAFKTIWDTFGTIRGTTYPDELVIIGGHRDAWGPGTADNVSGTTAILEAARAVAAEVKAGHRPKRTIVFATWDAEEWGLIGSTEYVEDDSLRLLHGAVMYVNLDVAAGGPNFGATGSPSLRETLRSVLREVPSAAPDSGTVYESWKRSSPPRTDAPRVAVDSGAPMFGDPGGGSDFAGFYNHFGVPIMDWGFGGPTGVYHSAYDDYLWMTRFGDPGYVRHATAARIAAAMLLRIANADVLPYDYVEYAATMRADVAGLGKTAASKGVGVSLDPIYASIDALEKSAKAFASARDAALSSHGASDKVNQALMQVERALTRPEGLRTRPWFRNLIFAADEDNGYANVQFPSVTEAIRSGDQALVQREVSDLAARFSAAARALDDATAALR